MNISVWRKYFYKSISDVQKCVMVKPRHLNFIKLYVLGAFMDFYESYHITQNIRELITPLFMFKESWDILLNFALGVPKKKVRFDALVMTEYICWSELLRYTAQVNNNDLAVCAYILSIIVLLRREQVTSCCC